MTGPTCTSRGEASRRLGGPVRVPTVLAKKDGSTGGPRRPAGTRHLRHSDGCSPGHDNAWFTAVCSIHSTVMMTFQANKQN
jgi:hypothetical protein